MWAGRGNTYRQTTTTFRLIADVFEHPESVRRIADALPGDYRYEFDDRYAIVNTTPLAGQTVTLFLEQDGNAPGAHEQIYYDNVWIH
jgi:hypothetical protein